ncbi:MAG: IS1595 family transposase [Candidatus Marinimicrobia bacterium]|nr:IS1595 family transposase [Candidatus Neomarinimicrobiota bacterium]
MSNFIDLHDLKILFPDNASSMKFLEILRWGKTPKCPHCGSERVTSFKKNNRHHCNACNISFSVTVNTVFHNTRIPLQKWFKAVTLIFNNKQKVSARKLASEINVNKNTAWQMLSKLNGAIEQTGKKLSDDLKLDAFLKDVEQTVAVPLDAFKIVILSILGAQEKI